MGINLSIDILKQNIFCAINNANLPIGVVSLVMKDITMELQNVYNKTLEQEAQELNKQIEKDKKDDDGQQKKDSESKIDNYQE